MRISRLRASGDFWGRRFWLASILGYAWDKSARMARAHVPPGTCLIWEKGDGLQVRLARFGFSCPRMRAEAPGGAVLAVFFLSLSARTGEERRTLLAEARRSAPFLLLADWRLPERNLDVPAALLARLCVGGDAGYFTKGALEGLLYDLRTQGEITARDAGLGGSLGMAVLAWNRPCP